VITIRRSVLMLCLVAAPLAYGIVEAAEGPGTDQVIVEGKRGDLVKAAKDVQLAEQRFYARYNELNTRPKYAVKCYDEAATGTRFKQKYCKPVYQTNAEAAEAREFMTALGRGASAGSTSGGSSASSGVMAVGGASSGLTGGGGPNLSSQGDVTIGVGNGAMSAGAQIAGTAGASPTLSGGGTVAAFVDIESGRPEFQKNVVDVASKSPELMKLLEEHEAARKRYDELYKEMNGAPGAKPDASSKTEGAR
jgi:hypothetical protein